MQIFRQHRQEVIDVLLQLSTEAHGVVKAFRELDAPSLPILIEDYTRCIQRYPPLLKHIAWLTSDIKEQTRKATRKAGKIDVRQTITQVVSALRRYHPRLSLLSELEAADPAAPPPLGTSRQVEEILERLSL